MPEWQYGLNFIIGIIIMLVTQLLKKWPNFDLAAVRFITVGILTVGAGYFLGWLYGLIGTEITGQELFIQSVIMAGSALGINISRKTYVQIKARKTG